MATISLLWLGKARPNQPCPEMQPKSIAQPAALQHNLPSQTQAARNNKADNVKKKRGRGRCRHPDPNSSHSTAPSQPSSASSTQHTPPRRGSRIVSAAKASPEATKHYRRARALSHTRGRGACPLCTTGTAQGQGQLKSGGTEGNLDDGEVSAAFFRGMVGRQGLLLTFESSLMTPPRGGLH